MCCSESDLLFSKKTLSYCLVGLLHSLFCCATIQKTYNAWVSAVFGAGEKGIRCESGAIPSLCTGAGLQSSLIVRSGRGRPTMTEARRPAQAWDHGSAIYRPDPRKSAPPSEEGDHLAYFFRERSLCGRFLFCRLEDKTKKDRKGVLQ